MMRFFFPCGDDDNRHKRFPPAQESVMNITKFTTKNENINADLSTEILR